MVVDLFGVRASEVKKAMLLDDPLVRKVRVGVHEGKVRVVFDVIHSGGVPYRVEAEVDKLAVTFKPGSGFPLVRVQSLTEFDLAHLSPASLCRMRAGRNPSGVVVVLHVTSPHTSAGYSARGTLRPRIPAL